ncbi:IQ domain-containing protein C isoform X2 [Coregonus clupeaformis]|uniref:IQ domain-containing protein C isoform X2 n=1 Tax=Coregonus clupeaformis TaxID=59861 RepID=UPI001BE0715E|nr:IQ domain-containing protein C isoform X2 [Coregonus clupeaformis]
MDGSEWIFIRFQAHARGYLVRKEINCARSEFEDIVRDIDGDVNHLDWKGNITAIPHFKDIDGPLQNSGIFTKKHAEEAPDRESHPLEQPGERKGAQLMSDRIEPERDDPHSHGLASISRGSSSPPSFPPGGEGETESSQGELLDGGGMLESTGGATTVWSSLGLDVSYGRFQKGSQQWRSLGQDVPHTPEALQLHRNTLTMEMLWLQQAIASRKKYLSLKERLNMS